jgi:CopA family copper-resistance protein
MMRLPTAVFYPFVISLLCLFHMEKAWSKTVRYELKATEGSLNVSGKKTVDFALLVNGSLPAPTLEFDEGDEAEIAVTNNIADQEISIHWHGLLLPPEMDGVPYVNNPPIMPGTTYTFRFKLRQSGTYWYHTHSHVQEQKGIFGALIIHPKVKKITADKEAVIVLGDWSDEDPHDILANLRKDGEYYLYKKNTVRSWAGAIQAGALTTYLHNEWTRMGGMDYSDVGYDAFIINGKPDSQLIDAKPGEKIRLRIVNASASSYFHVSLGDMPMKVISADGVDIDPIRAKDILIGMAETYDLLFEVPAQKNYEFRATAQDGTGSASTWIGKGDKVSVPPRALVDLYASMDHMGMDHSAGGGEGMDHSKMDHSQMNHEAPEAPAEVDHSKMDHSKMDHSQHGSMPPAAENKIREVESLTVDELKAQAPTAFPKDTAFYDVKLVLDGDMERYIWHINGKTMAEDRTIVIKEGDVIRFTLVNETMMHHPMHLHGHFFRVLNKNGDSSPMKHTVDVGPHMTRTIEFKADEPGEWMLHCHNLYHMKTGMARVVKYSSYTPTAEIQHLQKHDPHLHDHPFYYGMLEAATNHAQGKFRISKTWDEIEGRFETRKDYSWDGEGDLVYKRWINKYLNLEVGATNFDKETYGMAGVGYILPMLIESKLLINSKAQLRLDLEKKFQWTSKIFTDVDVAFRQKEETEWEVSLMYANSWSWAAGFKFTKESSGVGVQVQL